MAEEDQTNGTDEDVQDKKSKKVAKHDGGVADLERVTDYAEEKELSSADISKVQFIPCLLAHCNHSCNFQFSGHQHIR